MTYEYVLCRSDDPAQAECATNAELQGFEWFRFAPNSDVWLRRKVADHRVTSDFRPRVTSDNGGIRILADAS